MNIKQFEIRDKGTFIPALAIQVSRLDGYLMRRAGFGDPCVYLIQLETEHCAYDPFSWTNRTMNTAHQYIEQHWDELKNEAVIDVQFVLGETATPKESERQIA